MQQKRLLLVEDDPADSELTLLALEKANISCDVDIVRDGAELIDYLFGTGAHRGRDASRLPDVILLDLKMPRLTGLQVLQVLRRIRGQEAEIAPPVVVLTSSDQADDIQESYRLGAHGYVCKPIEFSEYVKTIQRVAVYWLQVNHPPPTAGDSWDHNRTSNNDSRSGTRHLDGDCAAESGASTEGRFDGQAPEYLNRGRLAGGC